MKKTISTVVLLAALSAWAQPGQIETRIQQENSQKSSSDQNIEFGEWEINAFLGDPSMIAILLAEEGLQGGEIEMNRHFNELLQVSMDRETVEMSNFEN
jgi:hypothetical protein